MNTPHQPASATGISTSLAFAAIVLLLGCNFVAVRFSNNELPPFWGAGLRFLIGTAVLFFVARLRRTAWPRGRALLWTAVYGLLNFGVSYALLYWALVYVRSGLVAVVFTTLPMMTLGLAVLLGMERLTWRNTAGGLLAVIGIVAMFSQQLEARVPVGPLLAVCAGVLVSAVSSILVKRLPAVHPVSLNAIGMATGTVLLLGVSRLASERWVMPQTPAGWSALSWLVMSAVVAFVLFAWVVRRWTASAATYALVLTPLVAVPLAARLVDEPITPAFLAGSAVILFGAYLGMSRSRPKSSAITGPTD